MNAMSTQERLRGILNLLETNGSTLVSQLAARFQVSEMTIRRDLIALERKGVLYRVHGGAVSSRGRSYEPPFIVRQMKNLDEKRRIGEAAAGLVNAGETLILDVGTTTLEMARHLLGKRNITVITPSLHIANLLTEQPGIRLILPGGILRKGELSLVGSLAERAFQDFFVDKLFLGVGAIDFQAGLSEFNLEDSQVKKAMLRSAKEIVVLADASKFGQVAFASIAPLKVVGRIVTDQSLDPALLARLQEEKIEVLLA
jgi:DeoR/GlpR family transcriptional regulator of sugar metabolism